MVQGVNGKGSHGKFWGSPSKKVKRDGLRSKRRGGTGKGGTRGDNRVGAGKKKSNRDGREPLEARVPAKKKERRGPAKKKGKR